MVVCFAVNGALRKNEGIYWFHWSVQRSWKWLSSRRVWVPNTQVQAQIQITVFYLLAAVGWVPPSNRVVQQTELYQDSSQTLHLEQLQHVVIIYDDTKLHLFTQYRKPLSLSVKGAKLPTHTFLLTAIFMHRYKRRNAPFFRTQLILSLLFLCSSYSQWINRTVKITLHTVSTMCNCCFTFFCLHYILYLHCNNTVYMKNDQREFKYSTTQKKSPGMQVT